MKFEKIGLIGKQKIIVTVCLSAIGVAMLCSIALLLILLFGNISINSAYSIFTASYIAIMAVVVAAFAIILVTVKRFKKTVVKSDAEKQVEQILKEGECENEKE